MFGWLNFRSPNADRNGRVFEWLKDMMPSLVGFGRGRAVSAIGWSAVRDEYLASHPFCEVCG